MASIYGSDLSTFAGAGNTVGANPLFTPIEGPRVVIEAVARRLMTPRGALPGFPEVGYDLLSLCSKRMTPLAILRASDDIAAECEQEARVLKATVVKFSQVAGNKLAYEIEISIELADGTFPLVLSVSDVTVELIRAG